VTEFITFPEEIAKPWTKLVGFVAGILLFISVFLPWQSVSYVMYSISCSGLCVSGGIGATGIVAGLICILAACLVNPKATGALHISMGILSLLVMLAIWFSHPTITGGGYPRRRIQGGVGTDTRGAKRDSAHWSRLLSLSSFIRGVNTRGLALH